MSATPPTPPEPEGHGPAFPGFKMGMGAPERAEPTEDFGEWRSAPSARYRPLGRWPRLALGLAVLIALALLRLAAAGIARAS